MARSAKKKEKNIRVTLVKSPIGYSKNQKSTIEALGFYRLKQSDNEDVPPALRGMVNKVSHLVKVEGEA